MPAGPQGKGYTFVGGSNLMMLKSAKNKDAAWALMKYLSQDQIQTDYADKLGMFPSRIEPQKQAGRGEPELRRLLQGDPAGPDLRPDPAVGPDRERLQGALREHPRRRRRPAAEQRRHHEGARAAAKEADALLAQGTG